MSEARHILRKLRGGDAKEMSVQNKMAWAGLVVWVRNLTT